MISIISIAFLSIFAASTASAELIDGATVLNDLSKYSKLYVSYHNCAWSPYVANNNNNACGGNNGGDYWYMGLSSCFRANVAYSLYGVLKDQEDKGCNKHSYINSFFTNSGISTFTTYMAVAGATFTAAEDGAAEVSSNCQVNQNQNGDAAADDGSSTHNVKINAMSTSYGVGCADTSNHFVMKTYGGAYCDEREVVEVTDEMATFNNDLDQVECVAIYDAAVAAQDGNQQNNNNNNQGSAVALLAYSEPCNVHLYSSQCPDPYGQLHKDARVSAHTMEFEQHPRREVVKTVFSWLLMIFGLLLLGTSALVYFRKMKAVEGAKDDNVNKKRNIFARSTSKKEKKATTAADAEKKPGFLAKIKSKLSRSSSNV